MRIVLKYALAFVVAALAAVFGHRWLTGRWPSPAAAAAATVVLFAGMIALDAAYGW